MRYYEVIDAIHDAATGLGLTMTQLEDIPVVIRTETGDLSIANVVWDAERQRLTVEAGDVIP